MYIISLSCIIYTYCKLILKSPSGRINKGIALYCIVFYSSAEWAVKVDSRVNSYAAIPPPSHPNHNHSSAQPTVHESDSTSSRVLTPITIQPYHDRNVTLLVFSTYQSTILERTGSNACTFIALLFSKMFFHLTSTFQQLGVH